MNYSKNIVTSIHEGDALNAHSLLEKELYIKANTMLTEMKKKVVAKVYGKKNLKEYDTTSIMKRAKRNAFKQKVNKNPFLVSK